MQRWLSRMQEMRRLYRLLVSRVPSPDRMLEAVYAARVTVWRRRRQAAGKAAGRAAGKIGKLQILEPLARDPTSTYWSRGRRTQSACPELVLELELGKRREAKRQADSTCPKMLRWVG